MWRSHPAERLARKKLRQIGAGPVRDEPSVLTLMLLTEEEWEPPKPELKDDLLELLWSLQGQKPERTLKAFGLIEKGLPMPLKKLEKRSPQYLANVLAESLYLEMMERGEIIV